MDSYFCRYSRASICVRNVSSGAGVVSGARVRGGRPGRVLVRLPTTRAATPTTPRAPHAC